MLLEVEFQRVLGIKVNRCDKSGYGRHEVPQLTRRSDRGAEWYRCGRSFYGDRSLHEKKIKFRYENLQIEVI